MLLISCPHCGPRDEAEFSCGGEAHIARPLAENSITDAQFADYLFYRHNPKGVFLKDGVMPLVVAAGSIWCVTL